MPSFVAAAVREMLRRTAPLIPDGPLASRWLALPGFVGFHGRLPRRLDDPRALYRDFLYARMLGPWTSQHRTCVDKLSAKAVAKACCPQLRIAEPIAVLELDAATRLADVETFLRPYCGRPLVAKPTHTSGGTIFLDHLGHGDIRHLYRHARRDYYLTAGETQYRGLPRRILVEESLADAEGAAPPDWRFACTRGIPWFGMADFRAGDALQEYFFSVPDFMLIDAARRGAAKAPSSLRETPRLREMLDFARRLSAPFEFVRIDLYEARGAIWFGEFTFTPLAARERFTDRALSRWLLDRAMQPERQVPLPVHLRLAPLR